MGDRQVIQLLVEEQSGESSDKLSASSCEFYSLARAAEGVMNVLDNFMSISSNLLSMMCICLHLISLRLHYNVRMS